MAEIVGKYRCAKLGERVRPPLSAGHADFCAGASPRAALTPAVIPTIAARTAKEVVTNKLTPSQPLPDIAIIISSRLCHIARYFESVASCSSFDDVPI
jgi:hypothetical protein